MRSLHPIRRPFRWMARAATLVAAALALGAYGYAHVPPGGALLPGLLPLLTPVLLVSNVAWLLYWGLRRSRWAWLPAATLALGYPFLRATYQMGAPRSARSADFRVLSYNVGTFNSSPVYQQRFGTKTAAPLVDWVARHQADILCLQEFYNDDKSAAFNTVDRIAAHHPYYYLTPLRQYDAAYGFHSMATFSRYPIVRTGEVVVSRRSAFNKAIFTDVAVGHDTLRVYNVHLESMTIDERTLRPQGDWRRWYEAVKEVLGKLWYGSTRRARQVEQLLVHVRDSPYPVLVCGDLNDLPYSYAYQALRSSLHSAFERAGAGFGFSYNGSLFFLRLDHHFFGDGLRAQRFRTRRGVAFTEHFPVEGSYAFDGGEAVE